MQFLPFHFFAQCSFYPFILPFQAETHVTVTHLSRYNKHAHDLMKLFIWALAQVVG